MSYATAAIATFANVLGTLDHVVAKAAGHEKGEALLEARLAHDMFPLHTQIRFTIDQIDTALARLGKFEREGNDSPITTFAEARARIAAARERVTATDLGTWPGSNEGVSFDLPNGMSFLMHAHEYCRDWTVPQAYFHLMSAYAILRMEGVPLGKIDYLGYMMPYAVKTPAA